MDCPKCKNPVSADDAVCSQCGAAIPQYDAPEGFAYDADSGLYYRIEYNQAGQGVGATWFDSVSGEYQQVPYEMPPQEAPEIAEEPQPQAALPQEEALSPHSDTLGDASEEIPEGFVYDENSGLYYQECQELDSQTNLPVRVITWFYPQTGQYERVVYPIEVEEMPAAQVGYATGNAPDAPKNWKKIGVIALAVGLLLLSVGILCWKMGWLPWQKDSSAAPQKQSAAVTTTQGSVDMDAEAAQNQTQTTPSAQEDAAPNPTDTETQATDAAQSDTPGIQSLQELQEVLLQLKVQAVAGTLSDEELQTVEEDIKQFIAEHPEDAAQIEQMLAEQDTPATQQESAAEAQPSLRDWTQCEIAASASSTLPPSASYAYTAANAVDGDADTAWVEGADGYGIGEWIMLRTASGETAHLQELRIQNGYQRTDTTYFSNARVKDIVVEFSDGSQINYTLSDGRAWQSIPLSGTIDTSSVKITIRSIYAGSKYQDTCLGEVVCR